MHIRLGRHCKIYSNDLPTITISTIGKKPPYSKIERERESHKVGIAVTAFGKYVWILKKKHRHCHIIIQVTPQFGHQHYISIGCVCVCAFEYLCDSMYRMRPYTLAGLYFYTPNTWPLHIYLPLECIYLWHCLSLHILYVIIWVPCSFESSHSHEIHPRPPEIFVRARVSIQRFLFLNRIEELRYDVGSSKCQ